MSDPALSSPHESIPDRSAWIVVFGIVEVVLGIGCVLLCGILLAAAAAGPMLGEQGPRVNARTVGSSLAVYLVFAAYFIGLGVGTIRKRRWARTLMLSTAWLWLVVGVFGAVLWVVLLPALDSLQGMPAEMEGSGAVMTVVKVILTIVIGFLYVALPLVFVLFFRSEGVRRTFETRDPVPRWTDRCSGGVLSMILTLAYGAITCVFALFWDVVPFFGILLHGVSAAAVYVASGAALAWLAFGFYELRWSAWWGTLAFTLLGTVSAVWTFLRVPIEEIYLASGLEEEQVEMIRTTGMGSTSFLVWVTVLSAITVLAYLLYLRREFRAAAGGQPFDQTVHARKVE